MLEAWRSVRDNLAVQVDTRADQPGETSRPVAIRFTVTNRADAGRQDSPEVLFEEVVVRVGVPPNWHVERLGPLAGHQTVHYEYRCSYVDLPHVEYEVDATLSLEAFFRFQRSGRVNATSRPLSAAAYLEVFKAMDIRKWSDSTIRNIRRPDPSTTLGTLEIDREVLRNSIPEIRDVRDSLVRLAGFVTATEAELVSYHLRVVISYLEETVRAIEGIAESFGTADADRIDQAVSRALQRLERLVAEVDRATQYVERLSARG